MLLNEFWCIFVIVIYVYITFMDTMTCVLIQSTYTYVYHTRDKTIKEKYLSTYLGKYIITFFCESTGEIIHNVSKARVIDTYLPTLNT